MEKEEASFVIIGGGIAGVSCAEGLAFLAPEKRIILITASPLIKAVTNIVPFSQNVTGFDVEERDSITLEDSHPSVKVINDTVVRVDRKRKLVVTDSGKIVSYEKLCLCNGARAKLISEGNRNVIGIRDVESVENFSSRIKDAKKILIVGNGGIATEIVHEIRGVDIVWAIKDEHISATFVDPGAAEFFQEKLFETEDKSPGVKEENKGIVKRIKYTTVKGGNKNFGTGAALGPDWHGGRWDMEGNSKAARNVRIEYSCEVLSLSDSNAGEKEIWPVYAKLTNGKVVGCDFVVSATGVIPNSNIEGLEELRRAPDEGFLVDDRLRTSDENVFAAGDICTANWEPARHWFQMRLWTQALQMGRYAAKSMACYMKDEECYQDFAFEFFTHVTKFFGYKVVLLGLYNGQKLDNCYDIILRMTKGIEYVKLVLKDGKMQGAVLIGDTDLEEMCENLILNQLDLTVYGEDLLNPDIDVEDYFD